MSSGSITLNGFDAHTQIAEARRYIGYCPQYDGLIGNTECAALCTRIAIMVNGKFKCLGSMFAL